MNHAIVVKDYVAMPGWEDTQLMHEELEEADEKYLGDLTATCGIVQ